MNVAIFHELPLGGARRVANEQCRELAKTHSVDLYFVDEKKQVEEFRLPYKVYYYKFGSKSWKGGNWKAKLYKDTIELWNLNKLHKKISEAINSRNYQAVIVHPSKFIQTPFILKYIQTKKIYYAHEVYRIMYDPIFRYRKSKYPLRYLYETLSRTIKKVVDASNVSYADLILVNSKYTKRGFLEFYGRESTVCYPGIDTNFFSPQKNKKDIDILFIGSLDYEADEFSLFKNALHFVNRKINVKIIGGGQDWITDRELLQYYRKARIVICTAHHEPLGLVPLEAAACEIPTIAVNEGGYKETLLNGRTGYLVKRNPLKIAEAIEMALNNGRILSQLGRNARQNVLTNWTLEKSITCLKKNLRRVV